MNKSDIDILYNSVNNFYVDRKQTLRYITINSYDVLYDNKIVFLGSLNPEKDKPADGKALFLVWNNSNTVAIRCQWKDTKLVEDSLIRVRAFEKPLWQLNVPNCLSSVTLENIENEEKEPFWELGEQVFYEGNLENRRNQGDCYFYHDYETKKIAKFKKFENDEKLRLAKE